MSVVAENTAARRLYERLGFVNDAVKVIHFAGSSAVVVRMRKTRVRAEAG